MEGKVKAQRTNIAHFLKFCEQVCKAPEMKTSKGYLEGKGKLIDGMWNRINTFNDEIVEGVTSEFKVTVGPEFEATHKQMEKDYALAFETFDHVTIMICTAMEALNKPVETKVQPLQLPENLVLQANNYSSIKLKPIDIPAFTGDYTKWISFKNMFDSLIKDNKDFSNLQKMHYLKSCLEGDAKRLISQFDVTEASFEPAYKAIKDRYNNEVILIDSHIISILSQPDLKSESSNGLKDLMDVTTENLRALTSLGIDVESWDPILLLLLVQKLDSATRRLWEQTLKPKTRPTMIEFLEFLAGRYHALGCQQIFKFSMESSSSASQQNNKGNFPSGNQRNGSNNQNSHFQGTDFPPRIHQSFHTSSRRLCPICSSDRHSIFSCENFRETDPHTRIEMVKRAKLCQRCLKNHQSECYQREGCRVCKGDHHTFIHIDCHESSANDQNQRNTQDTLQSTSTAVLNSNHISLQRQVASTIINSHHAHVNKEQAVNRQVTPWDANILLATAIVLIRPVKGTHFYPFRCLLDQGGETSHISESAVQKLGLTKNPISASMCGLNGVKVGTSDSSVEFEIGSKVNRSFSMNVQAVVVPKVANPLPSSFIDTINWKHIDGLQLADPEFNKPSEIDVILGASVYGYLLLPGLKKADSNCPVAQNTELGWILSGAVQPDKTSSAADSHLTTN